MLRNLKISAVLASILCLVVLVACEDEDTTIPDTTDPDTTTFTTPTNSGALYLLPSGATVSTNAGDTTTFKAGGGTSPYTFTIGDGSLGSLGSQTVNSDGSAQVVYTTKDGTGNNTLTVTDSAAATKQATITHSN